MWFVDLPRPKSSCTKRPVVQMKWMNVKSMVRLMRVLMVVDGWGIEFRNGDSWWEDVCWDFWCWERFLNKMRKWKLSQWVGKMFLLCDWLKFLSFPKVLSTFHQSTFSWKRETLVESERTMNRNKIADWSRLRSNVAGRKQWFEERCCSCILVSIYRETNLKVLGGWSEFDDGKWWRTFTFEQEL